MKETNHEYWVCAGNYYDGNMNHTFNSWEDFKNTWLGFEEDKYDDKYHFLFRFDILKFDGQETYTLKLCHMLQRKGIYIQHHVENISQELLDTEVRLWLLDRKKYIMSLWDVE